MGNKIFRISYLVFVVIMLLIMTLDQLGLISFGIDGGDAITMVANIIILLLSVFVYFLVNKNKSETLAFNLFRYILIVVMAIIVVFLVNDFSQRL